MTIWVVNHAGHDLSGLESYRLKNNAKVKILTKGQINALCTDRLQDNLRRALRAFEKDDILVLSGGIVVNVIAVSIIIQRFNAVKVLIFDARDEYRRYRLRTIGGNYDGKAIAIE